jgi:Glycosyl transferases group 1
LYNANTIDFIPVFLPYDFVQAKNGIGTYCLYHANLSVSENEYAATWLIENVFSKLTHPLIIAGKKPSRTLINTAKQYKNISIVDTPTETNMQLLIENAHINILPSFNATGVKLKLLNALYNGRFCLVNDAGVAGSGLEELCFVKNNVDAFVQSINMQMQKPFTQKEMQHRSAALKKLYNNNTNAESLIKLLQ